MLSLSNNLLSNILISIFGVSSVAFFTNFWVNLGTEVPNLNEIVNSPGSLQVAIYSFIGALVTFFLKQATSIKNIENDMNSLKKLFEESAKHQKEHSGHVKETNKHLKRVVVLQKEHLKNGCASESQVKRVTQYFEDDDE